ncbi:MAG: 2-isopropylmalate synthase, partial [Dehalococcoidales bacterium]
MDKVIIFDTTLRDGEQAAGGTLNVEEKMEIARQLGRLGVDVIEAGFPVASPGDFEAVRRIAGEVRGPIICGLARAHPNDIDKAWQAVKDAERKRIHVFISASDIHMVHQLKKSRQQVLEMVGQMVARAK